MFKSKFFNRSFVKFTLGFFGIVFLSLFLLTFLNGVAEDRQEAEIRRVEKITE
ncbi:hypothetical protein ACFLY7_02725 [Patescibacteria group bacterium]